MKTLIQLTALFILMAASCEREDLPSDTPVCIRKKISEIIKEDVRNPPAKVWQYEFEGSTVYYIPAYCCDMFSQLYSENCELICAPDGGIAGDGDRKCPDFFDSRQNGKLIWEDNRK